MLSSRTLLISQEIARTLFKKTFLLGKELVQWKMCKGYMPATPKVNFSFAALSTTIPTSIDAKNVKIMETITRTENQSKRTWRVLFVKIPHTGIVPNNWAMNKTGNEFSTLLSQFTSVFYDDANLVQLHCGNYQDRYQHFVSLKCHRRIRLEFPFWNFRNFGLHTLSQWNGNGFVCRDCIDDVFECDIFDNN